jgi:hypothetical protein
MAAIVFGEESPAVKFLDEKIAKNGPDDEVVVAEGLLIAALMHMHNEGDDGALDLLFDE